MKIRNLPRKRKKGVIFKIPKKETRFQCDSCRDICVLTAIAKIIAKINPERLIDREQAGFWFEPSCIDHINTLQFIQK